MSSWIWQISSCLFFAFLFYACSRVTKPETATLLVTVTNQDQGPVDNAIILLEESYNGQVVWPKLMRDTTDVAGIAEFNQVAPIIWWSLDAFHDDYETHHTIISLEEWEVRELSITLIQKP